MSSKFKGILERAKEREPETSLEEPASPPSPAPVPAKRGRPAGKRSDADFIQVTAYIRKSIHREVKIALLKSGQDQDFSELVDALLEVWVKSQT